MVLLQKMTWYIVRVAMELPEDRAAIRDLMCPWERLVMVVRIAINRFPPILLFQGRQLVGVDMPPPEVWVVIVLSAMALT